MADDRRAEPRSAFRVGPIDHVELFVADREEAAAWYARTLGFEVIEAFRHWADDPRGPLMASSDGGTTKLAFFQGKPQGTRDTAGFHRVAFRVDAQSFKAIVDGLVRVDLVDEKGVPVTSESVRDHDGAFSVYFMDPYGHRLEVTTYDYEAARALLRG